MNMPKITLVVGILLVVQGVGFYVGTSSRSITALIPAFVGLPILVLGIVALKESARKHSMHVAAALTLLGFLAAVGRMASAGLSISAAGISVLIMALLTGAFLALCIKSFVDARRRQQGQTGDASHARYSPDTMGNKDTGCVFRGRVNGRGAASAMAVTDGRRSRSILMNLEVFSRKVALPVSADEAFAWHERPGALDRLIPPWEKVRIGSRGEGIRNGSRVVLVTHQGPLRLRWVAEHCDYQPGRQFRDIQIQGPFRHWDHTHRFIAEGKETSILEDHIEYSVRGGTLGRIVAGRFIRKKIATMFVYRHRTTAADLAVHSRHRQQGVIHVAVTGSHGLIGRVLIPLLTTGGHRVTPLVRGDASNGQVSWDPSADSFDASALDGIDGVVHLGGENIAATRWTETHKQRVIESRVHSTRVLCEGLARLPSPPKVLVSASAIGFYGDRGDGILDEDSPSGEGFLAGVAREWEAATKPAAAAGIRVVQMRFGVVLSPKGGALAKMLTPFRMGAGGAIGSGRQYWSWISIDDAASAIYHVLMTDSTHGPVNAVAPGSVTNVAFTKTLGRVLSRPSIARVPAWAARIALGEMADELLLASTRVRPKRLLNSGFEFRHDALEDALRHMLGRAT